MINLFSERIIDHDSSHLRLFFDENWICKSDIISYGHDIEASWLLYEAAFVPGDSPATWFFLSMLPAVSTTSLNILLIMRMASGSGV